MVAVRVSRAMGSSTSSVRLPSAAMAAMPPSRMYFRLRRRGGALLRRRADGKRSQPSNVPKGQIHPHQTRPRTSASATVIRAGARCGIHWRAASIVLNAARGSKRKKTLVKGAASARC